MTANVFGLCVVALGINLKLTTTLDRAITQNPCYVSVKFTDLKPETKKYLHKRRQIIKMIEQINAVYEDDEIRVTVSPDFWQSRNTAEKILACVGINKPKEVLEQETSGYAIG